MAKYATGKYAKAISDIAFAYQPVANFDIIILGNMRSV